jgi:3-mercaptopyruvate sulfurtransferase SseA
VAQKFISGGFDKVYALKGGWREWFRNKYPYENKS